MRAWAVGVMRSLANVPRPTDDPRAHASGVNSDRILLFGSGAAVGWGVLSHDMALPGSLARAVSRLTGRGTDVDVVGAPEFMVSTAVGDLRRVDLSRYDAIVLTLGLNEAVQLESIAGWRRDLNALLTHLSSAAPAGTPIFLLGVHELTTITPFDKFVGPFVSRHRNAVNRASAEVCASREQVTFIAFEPAAREKANRYRSVAEYRDTAALIAVRISPELDAELRRTGVGEIQRPRTVVLDEEVRREALDRLDIHAATGQERFDTLTDFTRRSLHTAGANVTIIDGARFWTKSSAGGPRTEGPRENSICFTAIDQEDSLVIADASKDSRFAGLPGVTGPPPIRFYAGHRLEAPNGVPIGVLCVTDPLPRDATQFDGALLRDLALLVQKEIWHDSTVTAWP
jgi:GDSL-like Lipase/Acylhydrolase family